MADGNGAKLASKASYQTDSYIFNMNNASASSHTLDAGDSGKTYLDVNKWDYSKTTGKYRNIFLNETKKDTEKKIKSGEYILTDLNK